VYLAAGDGVDFAEPPDLNLWRHPSHTFQQKIRFAQSAKRLTAIFQSSDATQIARAEIARAHHVHSHGTSVRHERLLPSYRYGLMIIGIIA